MSQVGSSFKTILLLDTVSGRCPELAEVLEKLGEVKTISSLAPNLAADQGEAVDLVVATPQDLRAADQNITAQQLRTVLDTIVQAVCVMDLQGQLVWANVRFEKLPADVRERIQKHCQEGYVHRDGGTLLGRTRSLSVTTTGDEYFEARITPILNPQGQTCLVVSVSDVTRPRRLQQKMDAIDNAGRELVRVDAEQISKHSNERLRLLEEKVIRYTRELLHFDNFIIRLVNKETNRLDMMLCSGLPEDAQQVDIYVSAEHNGISGYVAATGRSYVCPDVTKDPRYIAGIDNARSSLTVPLRLHDQVLGVLNIESVRPTAFSEEDRQFAEIFGRYIAIALHILDLLVVERYAVSGRMADDVAAELASPLSDILVDTTTLMEDYIGHDDLRHKLQRIADNVAKIRDALRHATRPSGGLLGPTPVEPLADPILKDKRILVIDDEEAIRTTIRVVLMQCGSVVEMASDGTEALELIRSNTYDLVISDIRMPGMNGYQIFRAVKEVHPGCPVMFMTGFGYDPTHSVVSAQPEGLAGVLYKPFRVAELLLIVRQALSPETRM